MKEENKIKYGEWNEHLKSTKEKSDYSLKRMDLLVITISSGGLYVIFETIKEFKTYKVEIENESFLITSGVLLLFAIGVNFFSQLSAYYANYFEEKYIQNELELLSNDKLNEKDANEIKEKQITENNWVNNCNKFTDIFNIVSIISMIIGLSFLSGFLLTIF